MADTPEVRFRAIHNGYLRLNDAISTVVGKPCWPDSYLTGWRQTRDAWFRFYGQGVSASRLPQAEQYEQKLRAWAGHFRARCPFSRGKGAGATTAAEQKALALVPPRRILYRGGSYMPTGKDVLALLQAVSGEVAPKAAANVKTLDAERVTQTLVNRMAYLRGVARKGVTLFDVIVGYAQPLNPKWADPRSSCCRAHPERCTPDQIARRAQHLLRTDFAPWAIAAVRKALQVGPVSIQPTSIHYAAPNTGGAGMIQLTPHTPLQNTYWTADKAVKRGWPGYAVV